MAGQDERQLANPDPLPMVRAANEIIRECPQPRPCQHCFDVAIAAITAFSGYLETI